MAWDMNNMTRHDPETFGKVAVLMGGDSAEREIFSDEWWCGTWVTATQQGRMRLVSILPMARC